MGFSTYVVHDVSQGSINNFIVIRKAVNLLGLQVEEDPVVLTDGVRVVGVGVVVPALEVLAADEAGVHVDPGQGHGAQLLNIKIQDSPVHRIQVGEMVGDFILGCFTPALDAGASSSESFSSILLFKSSFVSPSKL